ncbi:MAG: ABC transporter ATP-binding protein [Erysipelothrix sp.]|nr:ABC transporter ATP-binding protein [Erysipelothrix sp.]
MKRIYKYLKVDLAVVLLGILFVAGSAMVELYQIRLMGTIIDVGIENSDMPLILNLGVKMLLLAVLGIIISVLGLIIPATVTTRFAHRLRTDLFEKIQNFSIKNVNKFQTASLVTRLTNDVDFIQRTVLMRLRMLVRAPVLLFSTVYLTYTTNKFLSRVPLVAVILLSFVMMYVISQGFPRFIKLQEKMDGLNRKIQESLINVRVIKSFVREDVEDVRFSQDNKAFYDASMHAHNVMLLIDPALMTAINFASIVIMYFASFIIIDTKLIAIGDLLVFINYLRFTMFSMMMITNVFMMMTRSKASLIRINEVFDEKLDIVNEEKSDEIQTRKGHIEFKDVSFKYYEDDTVANTLNNINFSIYPGERLGIIGSTGSGKTTLVNLLGRLMDVSSGAITVDGIDIKNYDLKALRSLFGFVPQKNILFKGTITSNLKLGNDNASKDLLRKASQTSLIYDYIQSQELKFESEVQQGGLNFSGGQRQRLCIARALVIEPKILILDDSTSALDAQTEELVMNNLNSHYQDMTLISIAQKISSVSKMDRILVLNEGEIEAIGTHDELLESSLVYNEIYASQIRKEEVSL